MTLKPYTNVYALLDDADEVIRIQKVEFTKGNISELEAKYGKHLRLGVLVLGPVLISLLPLRPEVYPSNHPSNSLAIKKKLLGHFLTVKQAIASNKQMVTTFLVIRLSFQDEYTTLWGYTCKTEPFNMAYSITLKQSELLDLIANSKLAIKEEIYKGLTKRINYTLD